MTRIQKERFPDIEDYEKVKGIYVINRENIVGKCKDDMIIYILAKSRLRSIKI